MSDQDQDQATQETQVTKRTIYGPRNVMVMGIQIDSAKLFQPEAGKPCVTYYTEGSLGYGIPVYDHRAGVNNRVHATSALTRRGMQAKADESLLNMINARAMATIREKKDVDGIQSIFVHLYDITMIPDTPVARLFFAYVCVLHGQSNPLCHREEQGAALVVTDTTHHAVFFGDNWYPVIGTGVVNHTPVSYLLGRTLQVIAYDAYEAPRHAVAGYPATKGTIQRDLDAANFLETGKLVAETPKAKRQPELVGAIA